MLATERHIGEVTHVADDRGFAFLRSESVPDRIFLHVSGLADRKDFPRLALGMAVAFDLQPDPKGPRAALAELLD